MGFKESLISLIGPNFSTKAEDGRLASVTTGRLLAERRHWEFVEHVEAHLSRIDQIFTPDQIGRGANLAIRQDNDFSCFGKLAGLVADSSKLNGAIAEVLPRVLQRYKSCEKNALQKFWEVAQRVPEWKAIYAKELPELVPVARQMAQPSRAP